HRLVAAALPHQAQQEAASPAPIPTQRLPPTPILPAMSPALATPLPSQVRPAVLLAKSQLSPLRPPRMQESLAKSLISAFLLALLSLSLQALRQMSLPSLRQPAIGMLKVLLTSPPLALPASPVLVQRSRTPLQRFPQPPLLPPISRMAPL